MKKIIFTLALSLAATMLFAQKNPFEKFTDMDGVTSVFISKNMMSLLPKDSKTQLNGVDVGSFIEKLNSILILTSENVNISRQMISEANNRIKVDNYELLMRVKSDDGEIVNFFMKGKPEKIEELIMLVDSKDGESVIMQFLGEFKMQDVQQMAKSFEK
jgi:hypothetical protein